MPINSNVVLPNAPTGQQIAPFLDALFDDNVRPNLRRIIELAILLDQVKSFSRRATLDPNSVDAMLLGAEVVPSQLGAFQQTLTTIYNSDVGTRVAWLATRAEREIIANAWWAAWQSPQQRPAGCPTSDWRFWRFFRNYVLHNDMALWIPIIELDGFVQKSVDTKIDPSGKVILPRYKLLRYQSVFFATGFTEHEPIIRNFFKLFMSGAHFVVVHSSTDITGDPVPSFFDTFNTEFESAIRAAVGHSHYVATLWGKPLPVTALWTASVYPGFITQEQAPATADCPFVPSLLVGSTAHSGSTPNTFFQLEGWPTLGTFTVGARHGKDFISHNATKWNISTYGGCVYSEKRGLAIFLAPRNRANWAAPAPRAGAIMPSYVGAGASKPQAWLDAELVCI